MPRLFGAKLRVLRLRAALTQVELVPLLGVASQSYITNLETDKVAPSLDLILRVATHFGITADSLLRDTVSVAALEADTPETRSGEHVSTAAFGPRLRALRLQHQLTQGDLARQLGLARQAYISNLEAGRKKPSAELVVQIADLFGTRTDDLLIDFPESQM